MTTALLSRQAIPVRSIDVDGVWPQVLPFIKRALEKSTGDHDAEDVRQACLDRTASLWVGTGPDGIEMVAVTEVRLAPKTKIARVWLLAGSDAPGWIVERLKDIEAWAKEIGCARLEMLGRKGWLKKLPDWDHRHVVMSKEL